MALVNIFDPDSHLGITGNNIDMSFSRALLLLAIATAPAPRSRYQQNSRWAISKYSMVYDPRRRKRSGTSDLIINPGIADLDPHQKTILSDDMGVALSLGLLDQHLGIVGIADVFLLESLGVITLNSTGGHRSMPDFLVLLSKPLNGLKLILLECKGSQTPSYQNTQLVSACDRQLANVEYINTTKASTFPRLAIAAQLVRGSCAELHISDPPDEVIHDEAIENILRANYLALEYSMLGDYISSEKVWSTHNMPSWGDEIKKSNPDKKEKQYIWTTQDISSLEPTTKFKKKSSLDIERNLESKHAYAITKIEARLSESASIIKSQESWNNLNIRNQNEFVDGINGEGNDVEDIQDEEDANRRNITTSAKTYLGVSINTKSTIWVT